MDETMQHRYYGLPKQAEVDDARTLFEWVAGPAATSGSSSILPVPLRILGRAPRPGAAARR